MFPIASLRFSKSVFLIFKTSNNQVRLAACIWNLNGQFQRNTNEAETAVLEKRALEPDMYWLQDRPFGLGEDVGVFLIKIYTCRSSSLVDLLPQCGYSVGLCGD
jgi:hypothetical protein